MRIHLSIASLAVVGMAIGITGISGVAAQAQSRVPGFTPGRPAVSNAGFPTRGYGVRAPFVRVVAPNTYAIGGNRPSERTLPPRFDPPHAIAAPSPAPLPTNTIDLPTTSAVSVNTAVMAPAGSLGWGTPTAVYRNASTQGSMGWNRNAYDQQGFDQRLSVYYKPSELAALQAEEQARIEAGRMPLTDRAASALLKGDLDLANELYLELLSVSPDDLHIMRTLGVIDLLRKRTDEGIKRIIAAYMADPLLADVPLDAALFPDGAVALRRAAGDIANLSTRPGRADAAFTAAILAQSRGDYVVAGRFLDRAAEGGLDPALIVRLRASTEAAQAGPRSKPAK